MKFLAATIALLQVANVVASSSSASNDESSSSTVPTHHRMLNAVVKPLPTMTFFLPLNEQLMLDQLFYQISSTKSRPPMETLVSLTISTDRTVVWVDHWEDGYDVDVAVATAKSTEIWGDGNAANGCAPNVGSCTNANDVLMAGTAVVIQNSIDLPRVKTTIRYDGGDRIQSSFPVAITRASYCSEPGSVLAGAVEVYDTTQWGVSYESPVGQDTYIGNSNAFELSVLMYMAMEDNTVVTHHDGTTRTLKMGESDYFVTKQSNRLTATKPIQTILLTGDRNSNFETRWYTLRPIETYQNSYMTPVGDSHAKTKVIVYNPSNTTALSYTIKYLSSGALKTETVSVAAKQCVFTRIIPTGSGAIIEGNGKFVALSMTDTESTDANGNSTYAEMHDWGYPLVPTTELTSQVLVGLGYACTNNRCDGRADRSVVWLSPMADADIYIDYQNTGVNQVKRTVKFLESIKIVDSDQDMSGANIFAVKAGGPKDGDPVFIAMAWGQDPSVSRPDQSYSLDMGTAVPPFTLVKVAKIVDKAIVNPLEELLYTIRISNVGHKKVPAGSLVLKDVLDPDVTYVAGSTQISSSAGSTTMVAVADSASPGTPFPLDDAGYTIGVELLQRGATIDITFKVKVAAAITTKAKIINRGTLTQVGGGILKFEATSTVKFEAAVKIDNTVYVGQDQGAKCGTPAAVEMVNGVFSTPVTYCYKITNTGKTHLGALKVTTAELQYNMVLNDLLAPGASKMIFVNGKINEALTNNAVVVADPLFPNGSRIPDISSVTSTDPSRVELLAIKASIAINNTVYLGNDNGASCNKGVDKVSDIRGSSVVYCFTITNTGDAHLKKVVLTDLVLNFTRTLPDILAPGQKVTIPLPGTIISDLFNKADVIGTPVLANGDAIPGASDVQSSDPSSVDKLCFNPSIRIENTVYVGRDGGKQCGTPAAVEYVAGIFGTNVTYCFKVINTGETHLNQVSIVDVDLAYTDKSIGTMAPGASVMLSLDRKIDVDLKNTATVTGNPILPDGRDIPDLQDVTFSDPSEVDRKNSAPTVSIQNTVALGSDSNLCGTSAAQEYVQDFTGSNVTYCFLVKNTGNTFLDSIKVTDPVLGVTDTSISRLAPGVAAMISVMRTITGKFPNTATVNAMPTTSDGTAVPNAPMVTASDDSSIGEIAFKPQVNISNTVYIGDNRALSCAIAVEKVSGLFGTVVTYCFTVTNVGNSHLDNIRIGNDILVFQDQTTVKSLAPGASATVTVSKTITADLDNIAKVTARPIKADGSTLPLADVTATDPSGVARIAHKPSIAINNTVYVGAPGSCQMGVDTVKNIYLTDVVYCLRVTNNGETHLNNITIVDKELDINQKVTRVLAPGESELISLPGKIRSDLKNTAVVTGNPILKDGTDIAGIPDVTHNDWSSVEKMVFTAAVQVANTVYLGNDGANGCGSSTESVKGLFGAGVTYCFKVTNTGQTHLKSIDLVDAALSFTRNLESKTLAPGESTLISLPGAIRATLGNIVNVTAVPVTSDGRDILDLYAVKASDPSGVEILSHSPAITIANTVYLGNDGGKSCATSVESVSGQYGSVVTYCFKVTNTGNSYLDTLVIVDELLAYKNSTTDVLAPGSSTTIAVPGKILSSLTNIATVTAVPILADGTDIPNAGEVRATDPSSVVIIAHKSGVNIENTVYLGLPPSKCGSTNTSEIVKGYPQTPVMFCFEVKNVGESYLKDVVVTNPVLSFSDSSIKLLAPNEVKYLSLPGTITGDITNTAIVTSTPALQDGTAIPNVGPQTDQDTSAVDQVDYAPKILIENSVYVGKDGGKQCGTKAARDLVDGIYGTAVTYCFNVTNLGDTPLTDVVIVNTALGYNNATKPLAPGEWVLVPLEKTITVDLTNNAVVTAKPTIPGLNPVKSEDPSAVDKLDFTGGIKIVNKVYPGAPDNGAKCGTDAAVETVDGTYGTAVVYCFTVTNTGDTHLADMVVTDDILSFKRDGFTILAPGQSVTMSLPGTITKDLVNIARVVANPVTATGQDILDLANVSSEDPSNVRKLNLEGGVQISNTVYVGSDGGKKCGTPAAVELAQGRFGTAVTYCFLVTNSGKSHLKSVIVENPTVGFADNSIDILAPGATKMFFVDGTITSTIKNVATVTGTIALKDGTVVPDTEKVKASDPSGVERLAHAPRIEIDNLVLLGTDAALCDTPAAVDFVEHYTGALVTYCFEVTNKGDTHLSNITIVNTELSFTDSSIKTLAPQESVIVAFPSKISKDLKNTAVVTGNPTLANGKDIPDIPDVTWSDGSAVGLLRYSPSVKVDNKVYIGEDNGVSCGTNAVEMVTGKKETKVIYCFNVTNTGDTYLNGIKLVDPELNFTDNSIGLVAPKKSVLVVFSSKITGNLTNNVVVTGNPSLADGAGISGAQEVTATDPSEVAVNTTNTDPKENPKPPYSPPKGNETCVQDKWKTAGKNGTLTCATKQVHLSTITSTTAITCKPGEKVNITVDSTMIVEGSRNDLAWYIAADGGDALTGRCYVNGLQSRYTYNVKDASNLGATGGKVKWYRKDGGDDDVCGDIDVTAAKGALKEPVMVNLELPCVDQTGDGLLDVAFCFSWKMDPNNNGICDISDNIPGTDCSCYCTRYDIKNTTVVPPVKVC